MKSVLLYAFAATLVAAPALAQDHADHQSAANAPASMDMEHMTPDQMHEYCRGVLGEKMAGRVPHSHATDKLGHVPPEAKPPSAANMHKMHEKCSALMRKEQDAKPKP